MRGGPEQQERGAKATVEVDVGGCLEKEPAATDGTVMTAGSAAPTPSAVTPVAAATPADGVAMMTATQKLAAKRASVERLQKLAAKRASVERLKAKLKANDDNHVATMGGRPADNPDGGSGVRSGEQQTSNDLDAAAAAAAPVSVPVPVQQEPAAPVATDGTGVKAENLRASTAQEQAQQALVNQNRKQLPTPPPPTGAHVLSPLKRQQESQHAASDLVVAGAEIRLSPSPPPPTTTTTATATDAVAAVDPVAAALPALAHPNNGVDATAVPGMLAPGELKGNSKTTTFIEVTMDTGTEVVATAAHSPAQSAKLFCSLCTKKNLRIVATKSCDECSATHCDECDKKQHKSKKRKAHVRTDIVPQVPLCNICNEKEATWRCDECEKDDTWQCDDCGHDEHAGEPECEHPSYIAHTAEKAKHDRVAAGGGTQEQDRRRIETQAARGGVQEQRRVQAQEQQPLDHDINTNVTPSSPRHQAYQPAVGAVGAASAHVPAAIGSTDIHVESERAVAGHSCVKEVITPITGEEYELQKDQNDQKRFFEKIQRTMPDCIEKSLCLLLCHFEHCKPAIRYALNAKKTSTEVEKSGLLPQIELDALWEKLREQRRTVGTSEAADIDAAADLEASIFGSAIDTKLPNEEQQSQVDGIIKQIATLLTVVRPLDIQQTIDLVEEGAIAAKTMEGQDVYLLLGASGSGKSTTIQFLSGLKMQHSKEFVGFPDHIAPTPDSLESCTNEGLLGVISSPLTRSETKAVRVVGARNECTGEMIFLCDTPGFGDTRSPAIDIANGIGLANAVQRAKSVRPVVCISKNDSGSRFKSVCQVLATLGRFIKEDERTASAISYIFTHYDLYSLADGERGDRAKGNMRQTIQSSVENKVQGLEPHELANRPLVRMLNDLNAKIHGEGGPHILDPLVTDLKETLAMMGTTTPIENPREAFVHFVSSPSRTILDKQFAMHKDAVEGALGRLEVDMLLYKLGQVKALTEHLQIQEHTIVYTKLVEKTERELKRFLEDTVKSVRDCLHVQIGVSVDHKKLESVMDRLQKLPPLEEVRLSHIRKGQDDSDQDEHPDGRLPDLIERGCRQVRKEQKNCLQEFKKCIDSSNLSNLPTALNLLKSGQGLLEQLKVVGASFKRACPNLQSQCDDFTELYSSALASISDMLKRILTEAQDMLGKFESECTRAETYLDYFISFASCLQYSRRALDAFGSKLDDAVQINLEGLLADCRNNFTAALKKTVNDYIARVKNTNLAPTMNVGGHALADVGVVLKNIVDTTLTVVWDQSLEKAVDGILHTLREFSVSYVKDQLKPFLISSMERDGASTLFKLKDSNFLPLGSGKESIPLLSADSFKQIVESVELVTTLSRFEQLAEMKVVASELQEYTVKILKLLLEGVDKLVVAEVEGILLLPAFMNALLLAKQQGDNREITFSNAIRDEIVKCKHHEETMLARIKAVAAHVGSFKGKAGLFLSADVRPEAARLAVFRRITGTVGTAANDTINEIVGCIQEYALPKQLDELAGSVDVKTLAAALRCRAQCHYIAGDPAEHMSEVQREADSIQIAVEIYLERVATTTEATLKTSWFSVLNARTAVESIISQEQNTRTDLLNSSLGVREASEEDALKGALEEQDRIAKIPKEIKKMRKSLKEIEALKKRAEIENSYTGQFMSIFSERPKPLDHAQKAKMKKEPTLRANLEKLEAEWVEHERAKEGGTAAPSETGRVATSREGVAQEILSAQESITKCISELRDLKQTLENVVDTNKWCEALVHKVQRPRDWLKSTISKYATEFKNEVEVTVNSTKSIHRLEHFKLTAQLLSPFDKFNASDVKLAGLEMSIKESIRELANDFDERWRTAIAVKDPVQLKACLNEPKETRPREKDALFAQLQDDVEISAAKLCKEMREYAAKDTSDHVFERIQSTLRAALRLQECIVLLPSGSELSTFADTLIALSVEWIQKEEQSIETHYEHLDFTSGVEGCKRLNAIVEEWGENAPDLASETTKFYSKVRKSLQQRSKSLYMAGCALLQVETVPTVTKLAEILPAGISGCFVVARGKPSTAMSKEARAIQKKAKELVEENRVKALKQDADKIAERVKRFHQHVPSDQILVIVKEILANDNHHVTNSASGATSVSMYYIHPSACIQVPLEVGEETIGAVRGMMKGIASTEPFPLSKEMLSKVEEQTSFSHLALSLVDDNDVPIPSEIHGRLQFAAEFEGLNFTDYSSEIRRFIESEVQKFAENGSILSPQASDSFVKNLKRYIYLLPESWRGAVSKCADNLARQSNEDREELEATKKLAEKTKDFGSRIDKMMSFAKKDDPKARFDKAFSFKQVLDRDFERRVRDLVHELRTASVKTAVRIISDEVPQLFKQMMIYNQAVCNCGANLEALVRIPYQSFSTHPLRKVYLNYSHLLFRVYPNSSLRSLVVPELKEQLFNSVRSHISTRRLEYVRSSAGSSTQNVDVVDLDCFALGQEFLKLRRTDRLGEVFEYEDARHDAWDDLLRGLMPVADLMRDLHSKIDQDMAGRNFHDLARSLARLKELNKAVDALKKFKTVDEEFFREVETNMGSSLRSYETRKEDVRSMLRDLYDRTFISLQGNDRLYTENNGDRDAFYIEFNRQLATLRAADCLGDHITLSDVFPDTPVFSACEVEIGNEIKKLAQVDTDGLMVEGQEEAAKQFSQTFDNFRSIAANVSISETLQNCAQQYKDEVEGKLRQIFVTRHSHFRSNPDPKYRADVLVLVKEFALKAPSFVATATRVIDDALRWATKERGGAAIIVGIGEALKKHDRQDIATRVIDEHASFRSLSILLRNLKMKSFTAEDVLKSDRLTVDGETKLSNESLTLLQDHYTKFDEEYWALVKDARNSNKPDYNRDTEFRQLKDDAFAFAQEAATLAVDEEECVSETQDCPLCLEIVGTNGPEVKTNCCLRGHCKSCIITQMQQQGADAKCSVCRTSTADGFAFFEVERKPPSPEAQGRTRKYLELLRRIMCRLFAFWTIKSADSLSFSDEDDDDDDLDDTEVKLKLMQPHAAQVLAIFRLLGFDTEHGQIDNHLVQILTGEGKSVTLAITATVMAMLGYQCDCVCYSDFLSKRDRDAFADLFAHFNISGSVYYGDFKSTCEKFINQEGNVRDMVQNYMLIGPSAAGGQLVLAPSEQKSCLLVDEVDKFFSVDFYGNEYRPHANVRDPTISNLIKYLWANRSTESRLSLRSIRQTPQYAACVGVLSAPGCLDVLDGEIAKMVACLQTSGKSHKELHPYETRLVDGQIGYHVVGHDDIAWDGSWGYNTMFAYMLEHESENVSTQKMESQLALYVNCGAYSYAEIPKRYSKILGVTGTLGLLAGSQKDMLSEEYKINKTTYMPSVYPDNGGLTFPGDTEEGTTIERTTAGFHTAIVKAIELCKKRAILIFFEDASTLETFRKSDRMAKYFGCARVMTPETSEDDRKGLIAQAATVGNIMLLTREFGRGNDFVCYDEALNGCGGVHVVQTFVSEIKSEEGQIMGRTARQGGRGSYQIILEVSSLQKFGIEPEDIPRMKARKELYTTIDAKRNALFERNKHHFLKGAGVAKEAHVTTVQFSSMFQEQRFEAFERQLQLYNPLPPSTASGKTLVLMDATGSMGDVLESAKNTVGEMFKRTYEILRDKGLGDAGCEMQFAVYRNYSSGTSARKGLLCFSPWESDGSNLRDFMRGTNPHGGQRNEAIEVGLQHANLLSEEDNTLAQIVLIGDMPPNTREEVVYKRARALQEKDYHYRGTKWETSTYWEDELAKLSEKEIPVHAFHVKDDAKESFEEIARRTGGECGFLDIESESGAGTLTGVVSRKLLLGIGGNARGAELVAAYDEKFGFVAPQ